MVYRVRVAWKPAGTNCPLSERWAKNSRRDTTGPPRCVLTNAEPNSIESTQSTIKSQRRTWSIWTNRRITANPIPIRVPSAPIPDIVKRTLQAWTGAISCAAAGATIPLSKRSRRDVIANSTGVVMWSAKRARGWWTFTRVNDLEWYLKARWRRHLSEWRRPEIDHVLTERRQKVTRNLCAVMWSGIIHFLGGVEQRHHSSPGGAPSRRALPPLAWVVPHLTGRGRRGRTRSTAYAVMGTSWNPSC